MTEKTLTAARALHARPASQLAKALGAFSCDITLLAGGKEANGKSVLSLMTLGVVAGADVTVRADGPDAEAAVETVAAELTTPEASAEPTQAKGT